MDIFLRVFGVNGKRQGRKKTSEDSKGTLSEHSVWRVRIDQCTGPERVLEVSRKV